MNYVSRFAFHIEMLQNITKVLIIALLVILNTFLALEIVNAAPLDGDNSMTNGTSLKDDLTTEWAKEIMRRSKAAEMHGLLNTQVDPCEDFYQYACGNWHRSHPAQLLTHITTDRFQLLAKAFDRRLAATLNEPRGNDTLENRAKNFYQACQLVQKDDVRYRVALQHVYMEFGKFPLVDGEEWKESEFNWWETVAEIQNKYGKQIILAVDIMPDIRNNTVNKIYIGPPDFSIGTNTKILSVLQELTTVLHLQKFFGVEHALAKKTAKEMINFERELVHGGTDTRLGLALEEKLSLKPLDKLQEVYGELFDVEKYLELVLGEKVMDSIYIYDENFLLNALKTIGVTPKYVVTNYIMWQLLQDFLVDMEKKDETKWCIERTKKYFGKYVDHMVYQRYRNAQAEQEVFQMWDEIREAFREELRGDKLDWIANATREYSIEKLNAMQLYINSYETENFADEYANVEIGRTNYVENVQQILQMEGSKKLKRLHEPAKALEAPEVFSFTPAYSILQNDIKIPVALLQPRYLWDTQYPQALKYATLGYLIAHEMVHGFDDEGRNYDKYGNSHSWWDAKSTYEFEARRKCFQAQYHNYRYGGRQLPNDVSQAENIADNAGVKLAYLAYMRWLRGQRASNNTSIDSSETFAQLQFSNSQLFFVAFAQLWCDDVQSLFKSSVAAADTHAPSMYRVIGALSNFQEFSWVFKCRPDAPMDPEFKCSIY